MDNNQPNDAAAKEAAFNADLKKEVDDINKKSGFDVEDEPQDEPETPKEDEPKDDEPEEEKKDEEGDGGEKPPEYKPEDPPKDGDKPDKPAEDRQPRPERYIPLPKYQAEKDQWQQTKTELETAQARIKELETAATNAPNKETEDDEVKAFSDKFNFSEDATRELLRIARKGVEIPQETLDKINAAEQASKEREEAAHFEKEYTDTITPMLTKDFPNASQTALKAAKTRMDELAHSKGWNDKDLDYVFFKNREEFSNILGSKPARKGPDGGKTGRGGGDNSTLTAQQYNADFKANKELDFSKLLAMPEDEREPIVSGLDPLVYIKYVAAVDNSDQGIEVNRGGRTIKLK